MVGITNGMLTRFGRFGGGGGGGSTAIDRFMKNTYIREKEGGWGAGDERGRGRVEKEKGRGGSGRRGAEEGPGILRKEMNEKAASSPKRGEEREEREGREGRG